MSLPVAVGVDGAPESIAAAEWAAHESELCGAPLLIVQADEWAGVATSRGVGPDAPCRRVDELLIETAGAVRRLHPALEIDTQQLAGAGTEAGLLVLGSRGLSGFLLGSVGMAAIVATPRPVVLVWVPGRSTVPVRSAMAGPSRDVVVGMDIDQFFDPLLDFGFREADGRGARLLALYGWSIPPVVRDVSALVAAEREMGPDIARRLATDLRRWRLKFPSVDLVERSRVGGPAQLLLQAGENAELVVVGRRVRVCTLGAHVGPVTHAVIPLRRTRCGYRS
ncbi:universal stress protein [Streptomyces exfoliatus]|uniref:universal stress protein n=1 Tax=Streptomyces exfoliatus TaxID=1905 RepID=UPI0004B2CDD3|nr:universal stress protein [Streptomyces exfoliatus]